MAQITNYYEVLGVSKDATTEEIKKAFRKKALETHPDQIQAKQQADESSSAAASSSHRDFQRILSAYEVLRDPGKRAQYDIAQRTGVSFDSNGNSSSSFYGGWSNAGTRYGGATGHRSEQEAWEKAFADWERRMKDEFGEWSTGSETLHKEREAAYRQARADAWAREKAEASKVRARIERVKRRAEDARAARQAATLRQFWQTHAGVTKWDVIVAMAFLATSAGVALQWKTMLARGSKGSSCAGDRTMDNDNSSSSNIENAVVDVDCSQVGVGGGAVALAEQPP